MALSIRNHWVKEAHELSTKKKGPGELLGPDGIVMHYTAGWTTQGDIATLTTSDRQASVQFIVSREGVIYQCMPANFRAWHAGPSKYNGWSGLNNNFIGIEICNAGWIKKQSNGNYIDQYGQRISPRGKFLDYAERSTASPPEEWHHEYHPRLAKGEYAWEPFYPAQLDAVEALTEALIKYYKPTLKHIVSHEEIDTRKWKTDPGPCMPMRRYTKLLDDRDSGFDPNKLYQVVTNGEGKVVVVSADPDMGAPNTDVAHIGQVFWVDNERGDWFHIFGDGLPGGGWMRKKFLVPVG